MTQQRNRYLLTGGGTGGHVYPAIAIADELRRREEDAEFLYVAVRGKAAEKIVPKRGYPMEFVSSRGWPGAKPSLSLILFALSLGWGIVRAMMILRKFKPTVIIATGGYVSAPIMLAWVILKRLKMTEAKAFVHEQNIAPGRLNRLVGKMATRVGVSFIESCRYFPNAEWVGYPVRKEVGGKERKASREALGIPEDAKVVLAFGGSQGARTINRAMIDALPTLLKDPKVWVLHGVGRFQGADYSAEKDTQERFSKLQLTDEQRKRYRMESYLDPIETYYAASDVGVCRAGAGTLSEVSICGLPAIIIPKANLPGDHQVMNARALGDKGAALVVYEHTKKEGNRLVDYVEGTALAEAVLETLADPKKLAEMGEFIKQFADLEALSKTAERIEQMGRGEMPPLPKVDLGSHKGLELSEMTGGGLVSYLSRNGRDSLDEKDLEYLAYRTEGYLASQAWQVRNVGVKLVGLLKLEDKLDLILHILSDPTPAPRWHRLVGGDLKQVGFIRRNAFNVLRQLNIWNDEVREAILRGLKDPYYEVRSNAGRTVSHFKEQCAADKDILALLELGITERNFEVARACLYAMTDIDDREAIYGVLKHFFLHPNWRIREAVVEGLAKLVQREVIAAETVKADIDQLLLTSTGFVPRFQIRESMLKLSSVLEQSLRQNAQEDPS